MRSFTGTEGGVLAWRVRHFKQCERESPVLPTLPCVCAPLIMMGKIKEKTIHHDNRTLLVE